MSEVSEREIQMSEKKAKEKRQEANSPIATYYIEVFTNGDVGVSGNIDNLPMYFDVINRANRAVLNRFAEKSKIMAQSNIIVPSLNARGLKLKGLN